MSEKCSSFLESKIAERQSCSSGKESLSVIQELLYLLYKYRKIFTLDRRETERIRNNQETTFLNTCDKSRNGSSNHMDEMDEIHSATW